MIMPNETYSGVSYLLCRLTFYLPMLILSSFALDFSFFFKNELFEIFRDSLSSFVFNIYCSRFYIVKITYFFKNDFYEKLFKIVFFRDFFKILV